MSTLSPLPTQEVWRGFLDQERAERTHECKQLRGDLVAQQAIFDQLQGEAQGQKKRQDLHERDLREVLVVLKTQHCELKQMMLHLPEQLLGLAQQRMEGAAATPVAGAPQVTSNEAHGLREEIEALKTSLALVQATAAQSGAREDPSAHQKVQSLRDEVEALKASLAQGQELARSAALKSLEKSLETKVAGFDRATTDALQATQAVKQQLLAEEAALQQQSKLATVEVALEEFAASLRSAIQSALVAFQSEVKTAIAALETTMKLLKSETTSVVQVARQKVVGEGEVGIGKPQEIGSIVSEQIEAALAAFGNSERAKLAADQVAAASQEADGKVAALESSTTDVLQALQREKHNATASRQDLSTRAGHQAEVALRRCVLAAVYAGSQKRAVPTPATRALDQAACSSVLSQAYQAAANKAAAAELAAKKVAVSRCLLAAVYAGAEKRAPPDPSARRALLASLYKAAANKAVAGTAGEQAQLSQDPAAASAASSRSPQPRCPSSPESRSTPGEGGSAPNPVAALPAKQKRHNKVAMAPSTASSSGSQAPATALPPPPPPQHTRPAVPKASAVADWAAAVFKASGTPGLPPPSRGQATSSGATVAAAAGPSMASAFAKGSMPAPHLAPAPRPEAAKPGPHDFEDFSGVTWLDAELLARAKQQSVLCCREDASGEFFVALASGQERTCQGRFFCRACEAQLNGGTLPLHLDNTWHEKQVRKWKQRMQEQAPSVSSGALNQENAHPAPSRSSAPALTESQQQADEWWRAR